MDERELLMAAYRDFNARRIEDVLTRMHPEVAWANGIDGGHVHEVEGVRAYWTRQWSFVDPQVEPLRIHETEPGRFVVEVQQVVRDAAGALLFDTMVRHAYRIHDDLIERMDIE